MPCACRPSELVKPMPRWFTGVECAEGARQSRYIRRPAKWISVVGIGVCAAGLTG